MRRFSQIAHIVGVIAIACGFAAALFGQTAVTSGSPVAFSLKQSGVLLNGKSGYFISVPSNPFELTVNFLVAPAKAVVYVYIRCGADVAVADGSPVSDTMGITVNGVASVFLAQPANNTDQSCYIASEREDYGAATAGGRITATVQAFPAGTQVNVSSLAALYLAGQPPGTKLGTLSVPANSPAQVPISLTPGQGLSILAGGQVGGFPSEGTALTAAPQFLAAAFGLSQVVVPANALIGVFVGDAIASSAAPLGLDFSFGDLANVQVLYPLLQQPFYVGNGVTSSGNQRVFVVPAGATRLFLASAAGGFNTSGSFAALVFTPAIPSPDPVSDPMVIPALANLFLVDQPSGIGFSGTGVFATALNPYSSPPLVPITLSAGQNLFIRAIQSRDAVFQSPFTFGDDVGVGDFGPAFGLSAIPNLGLNGVFVGNSIDLAATPPTLYSDSDTKTVAPLLQQTFYVGNGLADGALTSFTVPSGATRLFLAGAEGGIASTSPYLAAVGPDDGNGPQIGAVVSNAGFGTGAVSPGSMVAVFGSNLGAKSSANSDPLPTILGGTQLFFNTYPAPLFYVSPSQLDAQVPFEIYGQTTALVTVISNGIVGPPQTVDIAAFAPGIFTGGESAEPVIIDYETGQLVSPSAPASRGDTLIIWATGLGPTLHDPQTGYGSSYQQSPTLLPVQVTLKSPATGASVAPPVQYAGLTQGFASLYQINVAIPANAPTGTVILELTSSSLTAADPVTIGIQ